MQAKWNRTDGASTVEFNCTTSAMPERRSNTNTVACQHVMHKNIMAFLRSKSSEHPAAAERHHGVILRASTLAFMALAFWAARSAEADRLLEFARQLPELVQPLSEDAIEADARATIQQHINQLPWVLGRAQSLAIPSTPQIDLDRLSSNTAMTPVELLVRASMLDKLAILMGSDPAARHLADSYREHARRLKFIETDLQEARDRCRRVGEILASTSSNTSPPQLEELAAHLGWLEARGIAPNWARQVRRQWFHANFVIQIAGTTTFERLHKTQWVERPLTDTILGARVRGTSQGTATITPVLVPSPRTIAIDLRLDSALTSHTISRKSAATVKSVGSTRLWGQKPVMLTRTDVRSGPAHVRAETQAQIVDFHWERWFGRNIAFNEARRTQPLASRIAASRAARRAEGEFDRNVERQVAELRQQFLHRFVVPLSDPQVAGGRWHARSTAHSIQFAAVIANPNQAGAGRKFRGFPSADTNCLMLHESAVKNLVQSRWSGARIDEEQWIESLKSVPGLNLKSLKVDNPARTWKLRFDEERPVVARFNDNRVDLILRVLEFVVGDDVYPGLELAISYGIDTENFHWQIKRDGRIRLSSLADQSSPLGVRSQVFRSLVRKRFEPVFAQEVEFEQLISSFPALAALQSSGIRPEKFSTRDGWLTITGS